MYSPGIRRLGAVGWGWRGSDGVRVGVCAKRLRGFVRFVAKSFRWRMLWLGRCGSGCVMAPVSRLGIRPGLIRGVDPCGRPASAGLDRPGTECVPVLVRPCAVAGESVRIAALVRRWMWSVIDGAGAPFVWARWGEERPAVGCEGMSYPPGAELRHGSASTPTPAYTAGVVVFGVGFFGWIVGWG